MTFAAADISAATQLLCIASLEGQPLDPDLNNFLSAYDFALSRDHPGKLWWNANPHHPAIARALKINPAESASVYALAPFRLGHIDGQPRILAALPCPHFFAPTDIDWLRIETVLAWNPVDNTAEVLGDPASQLVGRLSRDAQEATIYGNPFAFFRAIAEERARFAFDRATIATDWTRKPVEIDTSPGLLLIGKPTDVAWPTHTLPATLHCDGVDPRQLNRALIRSANLPFAVPASSLRRAA